METLKGLLKLINLFKCKFYELDFVRIYSLWIMYIYDISLVKRRYTLYQI
jgi:hypothetical protein